MSTPSKQYLVCVKPAPKDATKATQNNPATLSPLILNALEIFMIEGLDVSASGLLRAMRTPAELLGPSLIVSLMLPRDYDPPVSQVQRERVLEALCGGEVAKHGD